MIWRDTPQSKACADIVQQLTSLLGSHKRVLLLVSGGSATEIEADILASLRDASTLLDVLPVDERYGSYGHADSNMAQLRTRVLRNKNIKLHDALENNVPFTQTVESYSEVTQKLFAQSDCIVGIFGIGTDGHTAGVLPDSPAVSDTTSTVIGYSWSDYERMTLGVQSLMQCNVAFVLAYGANKHQALNRLKLNAEPIESLPAKILYDIPSVTVYNDYITEG